LVTPRGGPSLCGTIFSLFGTFSTLRKLETKATPLKAIGRPKKRKIAHVKIL
jgi:hypothetical protein